MTNDIIVSIINGDHDSLLDNITAAVKARSRVLAKTRTASLRPGDRVIFNNHAHPTYLVGALATVRRVNQTTVTVDLDTPHHRYHHNIRCPITLIDPSAAAQPG